MKNKIIILGAGGHAKVIADIVLCAGNELMGFLDDEKEGEVLGFPILGKFSDASLFQGKSSFIIGVGSNQTRKQIAEYYSLNWCTAVHPAAVIASNVIIKEGTVLMAGAIVNTGTYIGKHCIINTGAVIEHDSSIADYVHISPHATLCGAVSVGEITHIGAGATVVNSLSVTHNSIVGAGAVVVNDVKKPGTYVGVPARYLKAR